MMRELNHEGLEIKLEIGLKPVMSWSGISDSQKPEEIIDPFLDDVLSDFQSREIEINFMNLEYMNSSTVPSIIRLMRELQQKKIKTTMVYNRISKWQKASFKAIEKLSRAMPLLTVEGR